MKFLHLRNLSFKLVAFTGLLLTGRAAFTQVLLNPATQPRFVNQLPIPSAIDATNGGTLTISVSQFQQDLGLKQPGSGNALMTTVWGYNGQYPGPTIVARKDVPLNIFWQNNLKDQQGNLLPHLLPIDTSIDWALKNVQAPPGSNLGVPIVTHLHGGHSESASDGLPQSWFTPDFALKGETFEKGDILPYHYDNDQNAATIWYHDHALGITRLNVYAGLAGFYLLTDNVEQNLQATNKLPAPPYDLGLAIQDRLFTQNGELFYPSTSNVPGAPNSSILPEFFGNTILVNGKAWPVLNVEPRQYRFRMLNGSDSRFYNLFFSEPVKFWQIASDQGMLPAPVGTDQLLLATGERKEIILDFSNPALWGKTIIMRNNAKAPYPKGTAPNPQNEGQIMAFRVTLPLNNNYPLTPVPATLRAALPAPPVATKTRKLILFEGLDEYGRLETKLGTFKDGALGFHNQTTENPKLDSTEVWEIYNLTADTHPIHLHLVNFQVLNTQKFRPIYAKEEDDDIGKMASAQFLGQPKLPDLGQRGYKDTYPIEPGEVARVVATFDREGLYVWHCHILSHEDHDMMRKFYVGEMPLANANKTSGEGIATSLKTSDKSSYKLYPNPFAAETDLQYRTTEAAKVTVQLYDLQGRLVKDIYTGNVTAGEHNQTIDGKELSNGLYMCEIRINGETYRERLVLSK
jgi:spore coat protein A